MYLYFDGAHFLFFYHVGRMSNKDDHYSKILLQNYHISIWLSFNESFFKKLELKSIFLNYTSLHISSFFVNTKIFSTKVALTWIEPTTDQTILQVMNTIQYSITFSSSSIYLASKWLYFDTTLAYNDVDC